MKKLVIIPGGFHPFHAGHKALYDAAREAFPSADVYVAATADTSSRPFSFELKKNDPFHLPIYHPSVWSTESEGLFDLHFIYQE